jgi:hypothetical protein
VNRFALGAVGALTLACAGCATVTPYQEPVTSGPTAELTFSKGHKSGWFVSGTQTYSIYNGESCTDLRPAATLLWTTRNDKTVKVPAGRRLIVLATTTYFYSTGGSTTGTTTCQDTVSFMSEAGHAYDMSQKAPFGGRCQIVVADKATAAPPPGLRLTEGSVCGPHIRD